MLKHRMWANQLYLYKIAMFVGIEVPVRGPEATAFYSQGPQAHLWSLAVQAASKGLLFNAEVVIGIVPVPGPLDCATRELKHLKSHRRTISMEAISWGMWGHHGPQSERAAQGKKKRGWVDMGVSGYRRSPQKRRERTGLQGSRRQQCHQSLLDRKTNTYLDKRTQGFPSVRLHLPRPAIEPATKAKFSPEPTSTHLSPFPSLTSLHPNSPQLLLSNEERTQLSKQAMETSKSFIIDDSFS